MTKGRREQDREQADDIMSYNERLTLLGTQFQLYPATAGS